MNRHFLPIHVSGLRCATQDGWQESAGPQTSMRRIIWKACLKADSLDSEIRIGWGKLQEILR